MFDLVSFTFGLLLVVVMAAIIIAIIAAVFSGIDDCFFDGYYTELLKKGKK